MVHLENTAKIIIESLMKLKDFKRIITTDDPYTTLEFHDCICKISKFGNVIWMKKTN